MLSFLRQITEKLSSLLFSYFVSFAHQFASPIAKQPGIIHLIIGINFAFSVSFFAVRVPLIHSISSRIATHIFAK